jgi:crotonobetainyl-CoA:carnitine CoA-transferase CaiB-like acyl-CoA transferase
MPGPLKGLRVLELARILAGPWAGQILADLGADVIKVERPGEGDDTRGWGPPFVEGADGAHISSAYYHSCNRGKRSIALDLESERGQRIVRKLAQRADVMVDNFRLGGLAKFGLDYATLSAENPRLILCSITGFGQTGPWAHRAGYDVIIQALGGVMSITGEPGEEPMKVGVAVSDIFTGVYSALAILGALAGREKTGRGTHIDMALLDTTVSVLANQALYYLVSGDIPPRLGNAHATVVPYQVFPTSDGHMIIACGNDAQFARLSALLGDAAMAEDERYKTNAARIINRETLIPRMMARTKEFARDDLLAKLEAIGVPASSINDLADVFANPQVMARGVRIERDSPAAQGGSVPGVRTPIIYDGTPAISDRPAPGLGEHMEEILREIGEV